MPRATFIASTILIKAGIILFIPLFIIAAGLGGFLAAVAAEKLVAEIYDSFQGSMPDVMIDAGPN